MSRLNLAEKFYTSFPDKTAYRHLLRSGEIVWRDSKGREKWRWKPTGGDMGKFLETETRRNKRLYKLDSRNPLGLFERTLRRCGFTVTDN